MHVRTGPGTRTDLDQELPPPALLKDGEVLSVRRGHGRRERTVGVFAFDGDDLRWMPVVDVDRLVARVLAVGGTALVGAAAARTLRERPAPTVARIAMGPGGWVSLRGSRVRTWGLRLRPAGRRPWWAHLLGAQPLADPTSDGPRKQRQPTIRRHREDGLS